MTSLFDLFPASSPPREGKARRSSPWFTGGNRRTDSEGKDEKRNDAQRKNSDHNESRTNHGNGSKQQGRQDQRHRSGSKPQQQRQQSQPVQRPRGNSGGQFRPSSGSLSANWRERQSEPTPKEKTKEVEVKKDSEKSTERKVSKGDDEKKAKGTEEVKQNGEAKSPDEKPSGPVSDEKPADASAAKSKTPQTKRNVQEN